MINFYKENNQKYKEILQQIEENTKLPEELREELSEITEKYRLCIYSMTKDEVFEKIKKCQECENSFPLKSYLHNSMFGNFSRDTEVYEWEDEYDSEERD